MNDPARGIELLTPSEMNEADRLAIAEGPLDGYDLMRNAGRAVAAEALRRYPEATRFDILCGPGNNGGDGYVAARLLAEAGAAVQIYAEGAPRAGSDAALAAADCPLDTLPLAAFAAEDGAVVIDALYGAGLTRGLEDAAARAAESCREKGRAVIAVDLPSGISGETGRAAGASFVADLTITFFRLKPGHLLEPGRQACGETLVVDIGIPESVLSDIRPACFVNRPALWHESFPHPARAQHKYSRGHTAVFSGGPSATGAARLAAMAAARSGAGAVTVFSPGAALAVNAAHLTSIMLRKVDDAADLRVALKARPSDAFVIGPGFGLQDDRRDLILQALGSSGSGLVLDADAITIFRDEPAALFEAVERSALNIAITPHEGEFARLFPDLAADEALSKLDRAREAARHSFCTMVLKGPDTVIAAPDGRAAVNENGTQWLATAGSGDVLAGLLAGLLAQKMPVFEAACAAVWIHAEAARSFGPGLIAEDLPGLVPAVLRGLIDSDL